MFRQVLINAGSYDTLTLRILTLIRFKLYFYLINSLGIIIILYLLLSTTLIFLNKQGVILIVRLHTYRIYLRDNLWDERKRSG